MQAKFFEITTESRLAQLLLGFLYATKHKFTPKNLPKDANLNDTFVNYDANVLILGCSKKILLNHVDAPISGN